MQSQSFTKLFSSITDSSIWGEDDATRILWITMLAMADGCGYVGASIPGLAARARKTIAEVERSLATLMAPDPYSRTRDYEGRRVAEAEGGWLLLNYEKHRAVTRAEALKESKRLWAARAREKARLAANDVDESRTPLSTVEQESNSASVFSSLPSGSGSDPEGVQGEPKPAPPAPAAPAAPVDAEGAPVMYRTLDGWVEPEGLEDEALIAGVPREFYRERLTACRNTTIGGRNGVRCRTTWVRQQFGTWKTWAEVARAKASSGAATGARTAVGGGVDPGGPPVVPNAKVKAFAAKHGLDLPAILEELQKAGVGALLEPARSEMVSRKLIAHAQLKANEKRGAA